MRSAKDGNRKSIIATVLSFAAIALIVAAATSMAPAIFNYLLQPWDAAKRWLFSTILNVFHLTFLADSVNASTSFFDKWAYLLIQIFQTFAVLVDELELELSQNNRKTLKQIRNISYLIEIPINGFYNYYHFSDGDGRISNPVIRWIAIIFFTAAFTLVFEKVIEFLFKGVKAIFGAWQDNRNHSDGSSPTVDAPARPASGASHQAPPQGGQQRPSASHF